MAHKTLIGGTAYEISGGKTLIGGTAYSIKNGKTLVNGTAYEVGFGVKVTLDRDISDPNNISTPYWIEYCSKDGTWVSLSAAGTYELPLGAGVHFEIKTSGGTNRTSGSIYLNDELVANGDNGDGVYYFHTLTSDINISTDYAFSGVTIYITEQ